jgi:hypothetical protein
MSMDAALHAGDAASRASNLPQSIRDLVELVGLPATMALVKAYGGIYLKVPTGARADGATRARLIGLMGEDAAEALIRTYGGERVAIARCEAALRDERDSRIIAAYDANTSAATIALREGMTERNVRNILKRVPGEGHGLAEAVAVDDKQMGLF